MLNNVFNTDNTETCAIVPVKLPLPYKRKYYCKKDVKKTIYLINSFQRLVKK